MRVPSVRVVAVGYAVLLATFVFFLGSRGASLIGDLLSSASGIAVFLLVLVLAPIVAAARIGSWRALLLVLAAPAAEILLITAGIETTAPGAGRTIEITPLALSLAITLYTLPSLAAGVAGRKLVERWRNRAAPTSLPK